jgi:hypothetical protein
MTVAPAQEADLGGIFAWLLIIMVLNTERRNYQSAEGTVGLSQNLLEWAELGIWRAFAVE